MMAFKLNNRNARLLLSLSLFVILSITAWRSLNYIDGKRPRHDSSIFAGVAAHMMNGRVLYRDIWDHKPPIIFLINLCALKFDDATINSVRITEHIFAVVGTALLFWIVLAAFGNRLLAFLAGLFFLFHMYHPSILSGGNFSEEYGGVFLIGGICAAFASRSLGGRAGKVMPFVCGFVLSLAVLTKEPFILSALPWFVYLAWPQKSKPKQALINAGIFFCGALTPVFIFVFYLLFNGAISDYINSVLYSLTYSGKTLEGADSFNLLRSAKSAYRIVAQPLVITQVTACLGLACLFSPSFVKKLHYLPVAAFTGFVLSFIAASIGRYYPHYYMQLIPTYVLICVCGLAFALELLRRIKAPHTTILVLVLLLTLGVLADRTNLKYFAFRMAKPTGRWEGDGLTRFVLTYSRENDKIWAPSIPFVGLYTETARLSPTKWLVANEHYFVDTPDSTGEEKLALLKAQLQNSPPRLIVITPATQPFFDNHNLADWVRQNYKMGFESKAEKGSLKHPELDVEAWIYNK